MEIENKDLENLESVSGEKGGEDTSALIEAIKTMKKNTVSREQYEAKEAENRELLDALINGGQVVQPTETEEDPQERIAVLRKELFGSSNNNMTNLEYAQKSLELHDLNLQVGNGNDFLPVGQGVEITRDDVDKADLYAKTLKECIEKAEGDSEVFTAELARRTAESITPAAKNYRR